ncbi:hypothetical protein AgCh_019686 [Apium graveolens]
MEKAFLGKKLLVILLLAFLCMEMSKVPRAEAFPKCKTDKDCEYMQPVCRVIGKVASCDIPIKTCHCVNPPPPPPSPPSHPPPPHRG